VAAFAGNAWRKLYDHALTAGYRFLSYGDSMLLMPQVEDLFFIFGNDTEV
jgi:S-adenosylmethionine:tRNA ribosyltransferase-isomerase